MPETERGDEPQNGEGELTSDTNRRLLTDLHDGPMQGLAAVNLQLRLLSETCAPELQEQLYKIRSLVTDELARMRALFTTNAGDANQSEVAIAPILQVLTGQLGELWPCSVTYNIEPENGCVSKDCAIHLQNLISESVSNAVRHGGASQVSLFLSLERQTVLLRIKDNGTGIAGLTGTYHCDDLIKTGTAPQTLISRVKMLGGQMAISTGRTGVELAIELPQC